MLTRQLALIVVIAICLSRVVLSAPESPEWKYQKATEQAEKDERAAVSEVNQKTFYELLGVDRKAELSEIKKAFRRISLHRHPDKATDAEDKKRREAVFPRYTLASDVLSDVMKRRSYDHLLDIGKHPHITDYDIEHAWDPKRKLWIDELGWAPLEDWHSIFLVLGITILGFAYPVYHRMKNEKEKKLKAEKQKASFKAMVKAKADAAAEMLKGDADFMRPTSPGNESTSRAASQKDDVKKTQPDASDVQAQEAQRARAAAEAAAAQEKAYQRDLKEKERIEKMRSSTRLLLSALERFKKKNGTRVLERIRKDREAAAVTGKSSASPAGASPSPPPASPSSNYAEVLFSTAVSVADCDALSKQLPPQKLQALLQSACQAVGTSTAYLSAAADESATAVAISDTMTEDQFKKGTAVYLIYLAQVFPGKFPDPVELTKNKS